MVNTWAPDRGDTVWIGFDPQSGHEQAGFRPAIVLSPEAYNRKTGLALMCPVTSQVKGYPFEVGLPATSGLEGAVLADQVRTLDWRARRARPAGRVSPAVLTEIARKLATLLPQP